MGKFRPMLCDMYVQCFWYECVNRAEMINKDVNGGETLYAELRTSSVV